MKTYQHTLILCIISLWSFGNYAYADYRCELSSLMIPDDSLGQYAACLEPDELDGMVIHVPSNLTRLSKNVITLCKQEFVNTTLPNPAIAYVVDQSGSMVSSGDPNSVRDDAIRSAIEFQANQNPGSWAGYVEFGTSTRTNIEDHYFPMIPLWPDQVPIIQSVIEAKNMGGTYYIPALVKAYEILQDIPSNVEISSQAIIFITDGSPGDVIPGEFETNDEKTAKRLEVILDTIASMSGFPPVLGVYLGTGTVGDALIEITTATGGEYFQIDPTDPDAIIQLIENVVKNFLTTGKPEGVNLAFGDTVIESADFQAQSNGGWNVILGQEIPIKEGVNELSLKMNLSLSNGQATTRDIPFTIIADQAPSTTSQSNSSGLFQEDCVLATELWVSDGLGQALPVMDLPYLTYPDSNLQIHLSSDSLKDKTQNFIVNSLLRKDSGEWSAELDTVGYYKTGLIVSADTSNSSSSVLKTGIWDTVQVQWEHPFDPRDNAQTTIIVRSIPTLNFVDSLAMIDAIEMKLIDGIPADYKQIEFRWVDGVTTDAVVNDSLEYISDNLFHSFLDLSKGLATKESSLLEGRYFDPFTESWYSDTVALDFEIPITPTVTMLDVDGDGRADRIKLEYPEDESLESQNFDSAKVVWSRDGLDTVSITLDEKQEQYDFEEQFDLGLTCAWRNHCQGRIILSGSFRGENIERVLNLNDGVGPIVLSAWIDQESEKELEKFLHVLYSEKVDVSDNKKLIEYFPQDEKGFVVFPFEPEIVLSLGDDSLHWKFWTDWQVENALMVNDSLHFVPELGKDAQGNLVHFDNPKVLVKGNDFLVDKIEFELVESLYEGKTDLKEYPLELQKNEPGFMGISFLDPVTGVEYWTNIAGDTIKDIEGSKMIEEHVGPTLLVDAKLPQIGGYDVFGNQRNGLDVDGSPLWGIKIIARILFYDQLGQFVLQKKFEFSIDDPRWIDDNGNVQFFIEWLPDSEKGMLAENGRAVASGPYISKINLTTEIKALKGIYRIDDNGKKYPVMSSGSVHQYSQQKVITFGVLRP